MFGLRMCMIFCVFICPRFDRFWSHHDFKNPVISCEVPLGHNRAVSGESPKRSKRFLRRRRKVLIFIMLLQKVVSRH